MSGGVHPFVSSLRRRYRRHADPRRAEDAQAYMKTEMAFWGLDAKTMRSLLGETLAEHPLQPWEEVEEVALTLWDQRRRREELYAASELLQRFWKRLPDRERGLELARHLVETGRWWDLCDGVAARLLGGLWEWGEEWMAEAMTDWGQDEELWIRRCAVLSQVRRKERTREEILFQLASGHLHETTFWMRKAIGWALREYGKAAPEAVARFVADHEEEMAGLTRREATKYL